MENSEHNKEMETDKETEVKVTDLPEMSVPSRDWQARSSHTLLSWQRSFNRRSWRLTSAAGTLLLALVAMLLIYGSLSRVITPSSLSGKIDYQITPTVHHHYHYIYLDHPVVMYPGHWILCSMWPGLLMAPASPREHDTTVQVWNANNGSAYPYLLWPSESCLQCCLVPRRHTHHIRKL